MKTSHAIAGILVLGAIAATISTLGVRYYNDPERRSIRMAKEAFRREAADPAAVIFHEAWIGRAINGDGLVCGYANAKNGFGAYTGRRWFTVDRSAKVWFQPIDTDPVWHKVFEIQCLRYAPAGVR